ncbi:EamA family transporter [Actinotignum urinale]|uniref:EamA family transporter n=1 Tax=Actinotignum urinale TaxID=190146 RepID=UPI00280A7AF9|nr:EamA family transporter [Actinotignum urinale]
MMENAPRRTWQHNWAPLLFLLDGIVEYSGSGLGVTLYDRVPVLGVAWGRFTISAIILFAYRAPHIVAMLREYSWKLLGLTAAFGLSLGAMNISFYEALARIPMGSAVALEYIGPVIMAVIAGKGWRVRAAILLALVGVFSISWGGVDIAKAGVPAGMGFAVLAGTWWIVYMVLGRKVAVTGHGIDHLTLGLMIAAVCYSPLGAPAIPHMVAGWDIIGSIVIVALSSSVFPFVLQLIIMRGLTAPLFALYASLLPATSMIAGFFVLGHIPTIGEALGLLLVCSAVAITSFPHKEKDDEKASPQES